MLSSQVSNLDVDNYINRVMAFASINTEECETLEETISNLDSSIQTYFIKTLHLYCILLKPCILLNLLSANNIMVYYLQQSKF